MKKRPLAFVCLVFLILKGLLLMTQGGDIKIPAESVFSRMEEGDFKSQVQIRGRLYKKEYTSNNQVLYLKDNSITDDKDSYYESKLLMYDDSFRELSIGQTIQVKGTIQKFEGARNPGNFDRRMYYARQNIFGCVLRGEIRNVSGEENVPAEQLFRLRQEWNGVLSENLSEAQGPVLSAMLLGLKGDMSEEMRELYQKNGIAHALSISGLHISFIGLGIYGILRKLRIGFLPAGIFAVLVLSGYSLMIGFSVSVMRAYLMLLLRIGADISGRVYDAGTALLVSASIAVTSQPLYLTDASFLLSYGAVIGILMVVPVVKRLIPAKIFERRRVKEILEAGFVSLAVQIFLLPIVLLFYYELPVYSVVLNILVVPLMSWVLGLGMFGSVMYVVFSPLGKLLLCIADWLLMLIAKAGEVFAKFPHARLVLGQPQWWEVVLYYCMLFSILFLLKTGNQTETGSRVYQRYQKCKFVRYILCAGFLVSIFFFIPVSNRNLQITMLDVGQGDCIFLRGPHGDTYLIDGGSSDVNEVGKYRIEPFLKSQGVGTLDYVFLSHGDADHYSGVAELLERQRFGVRIQNLVLPENYIQSEKLTELARVAAESGISVSVMQAGGVIWEGKLLITCLQPCSLNIDKIDEGSETYAGDPEGNAGRLKDNAGSMILQVQFEDFDMLFTGDVEGEGEEILIENPNLKDCDVLKVSHHGSKHSTSEEFLSMVRPEISLISVGENNSYGHPHKETLERLRERGSMVWQTSEYGAIRLETDGELIDIFPTCL